MLLTFRRLILTSACIFVSSGFGADPRMLAIEEARILSRSEARYPATMRASGVKEGHVSLALQIDERGQLVDAFIVRSSRRDFARSALKSIESWTFAPATCDGRAFPSALSVDLDFQLGSELRWQTFQAPVQTNVTQSSQKEAPITSRSLEELDSIPLPLEIIEPIAVVRGEATVEFYIDELGNVRCPKLVAGNSLPFGRSLLETVTQWRFQPPIADGVRTNTLVRQTFHSANGKLTTSKAL